MLTSNPRKKKRGRQPPDYGPRVCPLCATKLKLGARGLYCPNEGEAGKVPCGWVE
jgi:hypothetical protein